MEYRPDEQVEKTQPRSAWRNHARIDSWIIETIHHPVLIFCKLALYTSLHLHNIV